MKNDTLSYYRMRIDEIDDQIITLLRKRVEVVHKVGELKKETSSSQSFIRAGREAKMLRELTKKADGVFPAQAIATMWRMIISTSLSIEQEMSIYTYVGADKNCFWLAREYFGTFLEINQLEDADKLIATVAKNPSAVGVLPLMDTSSNPWWVRPQGEANNIYVFARIPFIEEKHSDVQPVLSIANTSPEATDEDVSLFSVTTNLGAEGLQQIFLSKGLNSNILIRSGDNNLLLEVNRFVPIGDKIIKEIEQELGQGSVVRLMGSYAVPIKL